MQAKDVPELPILEALAVEQGRMWTHWKDYGDVGALPSLPRPEDTPPKVMLAKMKSLLKRGLVYGCGCGCRGDWYITDKGVVALEMLK